MTIAAPYTFRRPEGLLAHYVKSADDAMPAV